MITSFNGMYRWLSNFYRVPITLDGVEYPSVEHAYQAAKTTSLLERETIRLAPHPKDAKALGYKVTLRPDWDNIKLEVMLNLTRQKFANEPLRTMLLNTGDVPLVEGNDWCDNYWGVCHCAKCNWLNGGTNALGGCLMYVREAIKRTAEAPLYAIIRRIQ